MSKLSPINTLVAKNNLNFNPTSQKALLQFAVTKNKGAEGTDV